MKLSKLVVFYTTLSVREMASIMKILKSTVLMTLKPKEEGLEGVGVRDYFANYFMGPGAVDFQYKVL